MTILDRILERKLQDVAASKRLASIQELQERPLFNRSTLSLLDALRASTPSIIAEVKKASPSRGVIRSDFDPVAIGQSYVSAGAAAVSVLTDEDFFQGKIEFIEQMRPVVSVPILRKDFIIDEYQLVEAKAHGADAVLLIVAALENSQLQDLGQAARDLGMQSLLEVHSESELEGMDFAEWPIVGINNRDLATFNVDLGTSIKLRKFIPQEVEVVSESAIRNAEDIRLLMQNGINSFLVGETLMREPDPGVALLSLLQNSMRLVS